MITCASLEDEVRHFAKLCPRVVHVEIMEQGLHQEPGTLRIRLQDAILQVEATTTADVIALGYGLCARGIEGVRAGRCRLVLPRAHDCITLLLGSRERHSAYLSQHPGTYWYSPGWNRHLVPPGKERYESLYREYCDVYGEDNAEYLMETEQRWYHTYDTATFVDLGVGVTQADLDYTRACADWLRWSFDRVQGDPALLRALLCGPWDKDRFLVLEPGDSARVTGDARVMESSLESQCQSGPGSTTRREMETPSPDQ